MPLCGGARDEPPGEVAADRARADEEAAAQRQRERRRRPGLERPDPLPRALDPAADGAVEDAAAGDLEVREAGPVEELGEAQEIRRRHQAGERLLAEDADRRVDEARHGGGPYPARRSFDVRGILVRVAKSDAPVRCVQCRHEYELPALGEEIACPHCGCLSWVSTRIADEPLEAASAGRT